MKVRYRKTTERIGYRIKRNISKTCFRSSPLEMFCRDFLFKKQLGLFFHEIEVCAIVTFLKMGSNIDLYMPTLQKL